MVSRLLITVVTAVVIAGVASHQSLSCEPKVQRQVTARLLEELRDVDSNARITAAHLLGKEGDPGALDGLIQALLHDPMMHVRRWAAQALGRLGDPGALPALRRALSDNVPVREDALRAIHFIGGPEATGVLLEELARSDLFLDEKLWIIQWLRRRRMAEPAAVNQLLPLLEDPDNRVVVETAITLAWIADSVTRGEVVQRIRDKGEDLCVVTAYFAYAAGHKSKWDDLVETLKTADVNERSYAASLLALIPEERSLEALVTHYPREKRWLVQLVIEDALIRLGAERVLPALLARINDESAVRLLERICGAFGRPALDLLVAAIRKAESEEAATKRLLYECLASHWDTCHLIGLLRDDDPEIREAAASALGKLRASAALGPLCQALSDANSDVQYASIVSLGLIGDPTCVPALLNYPARDHEVAALVEAFGRIGDSRAVPILAELLAGGEIEDRPYAAEALGFIGDPRAVEPLLKALEESLKVSDEDLTCNCVTALSRIRHLSAQPAILALTENDSADIRQCVCDALGKIGGPRALVALIRLLQDEDVEVRRRAAIGLGRLRDPRGAAPLVAELTRSRKEDWDTANRVLDALTALGECAVDLVGAELSNPNEEVRFDAVLALSYIGGSEAQAAISDLLKREKSEQVREGAESALRELASPRHQQ